MSNLILRWCLGIQDTTRLSDFKDEDNLHNIIWLAKLSIASFQKWFPEARCMLYYNGDNLEQFKSAFHSISFDLFREIEFVHQTELFTSGKLNNPYHFVPQGVWWKWVPFRVDKTCHEVSIDTDIICISEPLDWYKWLEGNQEIIVAPERFSEILVNTCGDFHSHPILKDKFPVNCGIVGHRAGHDFSDEFFQITKEIQYGRTYNSLFITEQGAINVWVYSLQALGICPYILNFETCSWIRDFVYYLEKGVKVETVHATTWHKQIAKSLRPILEKRVLSNCSDDEFLHDVIKQAKSLDIYAKHTISRQLGADRKQVEFYF